ncbi:AMP-binding protein [Sulfitobacter sp. JB4-11]|uniref:AMP-binding protein n=1 Tax=Sulfitobacter rhodophyticola TaxID=3238304 RepID=UPI003D815D76
MAELSYVCGTSDKPLLFKTIGKAIEEAAQRWGQREALVVSHQGIRWTYAELLARADDIAAGLLATGLAPGDRVGVWSPNNAEWVLAQLATARAGLIQVNINPAYRLNELEYALSAVGCKALILAERFKTSDYIGMVRTLVPELASAPPGQVSSAALPALKTLVTISEKAHAGCIRFDDLTGLATAADRRRLSELQAVLQPDDPINIQFTSGTTGRPKGATLTHHNSLNNGYFVTERQHFTSKDRLCIPVPLYHCFGMVMGVLGCITHGSCMVFPGEAFDPAITLAVAAREKCTALYGVPTMFIAMLEDPGFADHDLSALRTGVMAGSSCPADVMKRVIAEMHMSDVTICYGMTETSPVSMQSNTDDPVEKRVSTVGQIHPFVEVKIIDDQGRVLPRGQQGEFLTRGYSVMSGYWGDAEKTAEAIDRAGWMHTGDLAVMDDQGYVDITGRLKDMVIRGGENIYPREVEEFLYTHPAVRDVQVFGIPDDKYGEAVCAWIQLKEGAQADADAIKAFCKDQITHFKIPSHIRFVDAYPMTVTGKIQKFEMRNQMIEAFKTDAKQHRRAKPSAQPQPGQ